MEEHHESGAVSLIKAGMWPTVVLISLWLFYSPIHKTLDSLATRSNSIQTLKLGSLELDIKPSDLPLPAADVTKTLKRLDRATILELLPIDEKWGSHSLLLLDE
jgi:hypothetical protein